MKEEFTQERFHMANDYTPTKTAELLFEAVAQQSLRARSGTTLSAVDTAYMFGKTAEGLGQLAVGLRATYILLAEVNERLKRQQ